MMIHVSEHEVPVVTRREAREQTGESNAVGTAGARDQQRSGFRRDLLRFEQSLESSLRMRAPHASAKPARARASFPGLESTCVYRTVSCPWRDRFRPWLCRG